MTSARVRSENRVRRRLRGGPATVGPFVVLSFPDSSGTSLPFDTTFVAHAEVEDQNQSDEGSDKLAVDEERTHN
jgi:hypothetical protein